MRIAREAGHDALEVAVGQLLVHQLHRDFQGSVEYVTGKESQTPMSFMPWKAGSEPLSPLAPDSLTIGGV